MLSTGITPSSGVAEKVEYTKRLFREMGAALVAFSGGVDSTLLAVLATRTIGNKALAVFANSPVVSAHELVLARNTAALLGLNYVEIVHDQLQVPEFTRNNKERCYYCKLDLHKLLKALASQHKIDWICEGSNYDDLSDYRPGLRAVKETDMRSPLAESFLTKAEIRAVSKDLGLATWDKPSAPCLSSRIPYGIPVTRQVIEKIDKGESYLKGLGIRDVRLRHHDDVARIEVSEADMAIVLDPGNRTAIVAEMKSLGYAYVTIDLQGFRSGSLNEVLKRPAPGSK